MFCQLYSIFLCLAAAALPGSAPLRAATATDIPAGTLPITTRSNQARRLFDSGLVKMENLHSIEGIQDLRKAAEIDPDFGLAEILISFESVDPAVDPAEKVAAREKAKAARTKVSHGEQLVIDWISDSSEGKMVPAIQAMNSVLDEYPNDKMLAWLGGIWIENQQQITRAIPIFERATRLDPNFAAPLNELGYCYARVRDFDGAFAAMQRYIALLPNESNPQDSYAEILRMAGRFDDALAHYHASLKIDPNFWVSQLGIADTYALMGDEERARAEYVIAIRHAGSKMEAANWRLQSAMTYVRERDYKAADEAFLAVARQAHKDELLVPEAEAYRMMAAYQPNDSSAMDLLTRAEDVLNLKHPLPNINRQQELALILRTRAERAASDGNGSPAGAALKRLRELLENSNDQVVQLQYDGAAGAILVAEGKYGQALPHLQEDSRNPLSMRLMVEAYRKTGAREMAEELSRTLANWNEPTLEQALVVPEFRERQATAASSFKRM
ncbi:MAG: tetratricopeptide repeat protein [Actinomycetota bacterium]